MLIPKNIKFTKIANWWNNKINSFNIKIPRYYNTDTYRNNMNDFVLIYFTEDEIYVRPPTVNILQNY